MDRGQPISEEEIDFLVKIGAGKVPPTGTKERESFERALRGSGLIPREPPVDN